jgi:hypothetical protein
VMNILPDVKYIALATDQPYLLSNVGEVGILYFRCIFLLNCYELCRILESFIRISSLRSRSTFMKLVRLCLILVFCRLVIKNFEGNPILEGK